MFELLAALALILSLVALSRAGKAQQQAQTLARRLELLEAELRAARLRQPGATLPPVTVGERVAPGGQEPPTWPEDQPAAPPLASLAAPPRARGPSLWGPQFSRARISLIGGVLVLGGLAFTLRALGAPAWTLLLAVFAFGGLLYFNARRVPWPVSGALRGLGYGVAALGVGSLSAQLSAQLPGGWGPGAVMLGLLGLSAALLFDALRRRELLLGALAVGGAALSTWMLTDDLGEWSIPAAGAALLLAAVAVWPGCAAQDAVHQDKGEDDAAGPTAHASLRAALALTLGAAGTVPLGWFVASLNHVGNGPARLLEGELGRGVLAAALHLPPGPLGLLPWLAFSVLALGVPLALLSRLRQRAGEDPSDGRPDGVSLGAAWASLAPQVLVAAAVGAALGDTGSKAGALGLTLAILAALLAAVWLAWTRRGAQDSPLAGAVAGAVAGSLTAGAAGVAGALALSVLGPRTEPLALAGVAAALLLVGLYGRSRFWLRVGALALALTALWGAWMTVGFGAVPLLASPDDLRTALLGAAPAALGLLAAWRVGRDSWAMTLPRQVRKTSAQSVENAPRTELSRIPTLLAGLCSAVLALALLAAGSAALAGGVLIAAAALWTRSQERSENTVPFWVAAPLLTLGSLLLTQATVPTPPLLLGVAVALLAGAALLRAAGRSFADAAPRGLAEGTALTVLALALTRAAQEWWPALGLPGALALLAVLTAPLRLALGWSRMDALLGLGGLVLLSLIMAGWPVDVPDSYGGANDRIQVAALGGPLLAAAWWLTRTAGGLLRWLAPLTRPFGGLPPDAGAQPPVAQALWLGAWALLVPLALGVRFSVLKADLKPWLVASSLALLLVGLVAAVRAHRAGNTGGAGGTGAPWARALWTAGLALIAGAGVKGALLDAAYFPNSAAGLGIAVLVTGLSLLAVAILAPRPAAPAPASEKLSGGPPG